MVLEVRDLWPTVPVAIGALRNPASIAAARWLERTAYRRSTRIVALSPTMKKGIARTGYPESQITVIPNACDLAVFDVNAECGRQLRDAHSWLRDRRLVVYTGALGRVNGVDYIARLAAEVKHVADDICFVVVGEGIEESKVRAVAEQLGVLGRNFFMLPTMPKADVARWLSAADVAMSVVVDLPALWANSANKVFDALAASRPVAINHEGWLADLFRETGAGLVLHPQDINHAALTLIQAIRDRDWLETAGVAARRLAGERFHRDQLAAQLERVLVAAVEDRCAGTLENGLQSSGSRQHG
jgi:glycosyltransferase involved in cell wall biosynthesis